MHYSIMTRKGYRPYEKVSKGNTTIGSCRKCGCRDEILIIGETGSELGKCKHCNYEFKL